MKKTLTELQVFLNTNALDFDTLKVLAKERGYTLSHYITTHTYYILKTEKD